MILSPKWPWAWGHSPFHSFLIPVFGTVAILMAGLLGGVLLFRVSRTGRPARGPDRRQGKT